MNTDSVIALARSLMTHHGVGYLQFGFADALGPNGMAAGQTNYVGIVASKITLSLPWVLYLPESAVREIILHEIAHAKSKPGTDDHGPQWVAECHKLGIEPKVKFLWPSCPFDNKPVR